jgi:hypothetical protein
MVGCPTKNITLLVRFSQFKPNMAHKGEFTPHAAQRAARAFPSRQPFDGDFSTTRFQHAAVEPSRLLRVLIKRADVGFWGRSGNLVLDQSKTGFDPDRSFCPHDRAMERWYHPSIA